MAEKYCESKLCNLLIAVAAILEEILLFAIISATFFISFQTFVYYSYIIIPICEFVNSFISHFGI